MCATEEKDVRVKEVMDELEETKKQLREAEAAAAEKAHGRENLAEGAAKGPGLQAEELRAEGVVWSAQPLNGHAYVLENQRLRERIEELEAEAKVLRRQVHRSVLFVRHGLESSRQDSTCWKRELKEAEEEAAALHEELAAVRATTSKVDAPSAEQLDMARQQARGPGTIVTGYGPAGRRHAYTLLHCHVHRHVYRGHTCLRMV